ncbi:uncharacterized protein [Primulina eburnea]|uniref:uncharacterized protein isoform X2 n=1 Tax=Primulina eburnea TaxID=1245227 RepID=UPI003C6CAC55
MAHCPKSGPRLLLNNLESRTRGGLGLPSGSYFPFDLFVFPLSRPNPVIVGGLHPMGTFSDSRLRDLCDEYFDPRKSICCENPRKAICGGGTTRFHVGGLAHIKDKAETALNFYNKKKRKNFVLDKVVKVNRVSGGAMFCMTFWAKRDENDERCLFRGVYCEGKVLLCEIKDGDCEITIPAGHVDGVPGPSPIGTDDPFYEWYLNAPDVSSEDEDDEDDSEGLHPMGTFSDSRLRDLCDEYFDPRKSICCENPRKAICGGGTTRFHVGGLAHIKDKAETALNFYNKKKRKNFVLDKVVKVNRVSGGAMFCMTFWAKRDENDERHLFRGVYCQGKVLLCEIKDGDCEITIPAGHVDGVPGPSPIGTDDPFYEWYLNAPDVCSEDEDDEDDSEDEKY